MRTASASLARRLTKRYTEKGTVMDALKSPKGWGNDELSQFLSAAHVNTFAMFQDKADYYDKLSKINDLICKSIESTANTNLLIPSIVLLRAHASYLAAVRLALATQACESFMAQRGALEAAVYSEYIANNKEASTKWLNRNDSDTALGQMRREFRIGPIMEELKGRDLRVGRAIRTLYEITIDWGAHPNPRGVMGTMEVESDSDNLSIELQYLTTKDEQIELALKSTARVGIGVLELYGLVFPKRFEIACLDQEIQRLSKGL